MQINDESAFKNLGDKKTGNNTLEEEIKERLINVNKAHC